MSDSSSLRFLVACDGCKRQFDARGLAERSRFHCSCGATVEVPRFTVQEAAVVRCSSCSAPRTKGSLACAHCGADYTLHEQDMHTICPSCMARVSDRARYCHHCATPIVPQGEAGRPGRRPCPACGPRHRLNSRSLGRPAVAVLECPRCAGMWIGQDTFRLLADHARERKVEDVLMGEPSRADAARVRDVRATSLYRRCPECDKHMNRKNFGKQSGVIVDSCREHGIWFDATELDAILAWVRRGGEDRVAEKVAMEQRHRERQSRVNWDPLERAKGSEGLNYSGSRDESLDWARAILGTLFDL